MIDATAAKITSMHFHGWQRGLKTGMPLAARKTQVDHLLSMIPPLLACGYRLSMKSKESNDSCDFCTFFDQFLGNVLQLLLVSHSYTHTHTESFLLGHSLMST